MASPAKTQSPEQALDCTACQGQCCSYFALQIDRPKTPEDYDNIRWYLAHLDVAVFIEKKDWYLQVNNRCRFLNEQFQCAIYDRRPQICRDYGWDATGKTECHGTDNPCDHDHFFSTLEAFEAYLEANGKRWASRARGHRLKATSA